METIMQYITLYAPIVIAVVGEVGIIAAMLTKVQAFFKKTDKAVSELKESNEIKEIKSQVRIVLDENIKLKKQLDKVMEKLTHVKVKDEAEPDKEI